MSNTEHIAGQLSRRYIEESFPIREVGEISAKEKNSRHGNIGTLHTWWSRKPLAVSCATIFASLVHPDTEIEDWKKRQAFIIELSNWHESLGTRLDLRAREEILRFNSGVAPRILDPFAGGGSIPLAGLRLGCEVHSFDYNPVAVIIQKASLEYPQMFGHITAALDYIGVSPNWKNADSQNALPGLLVGGDREGQITNPLLEAVRYWGKQISDAATAELGDMYPPDPNGCVPICYIWAHVVPCQNPSCGTQIPLLSQLWLSKKQGANVALYPYVTQRKLHFRIVGDGYAAWPQGFDATKGTVDQAVVTCPVCGSIIDDGTTPKMFVQGRASEQLLAVVLQNRNGKGKKYRLSNQSDLVVYEEASEKLKGRIAAASPDSGYSLIPDEPLPPVGTLGFRIQRYGMKHWGDLFNSRQQLTLLTFSLKVKHAHEAMIAGGVDAEFARAVTTYLGLAVDRLADFGSKLCMLNPTGGRGVVHTFGRQALHMVWAYAESNPFFEEAAGWTMACKKNEDWIKYVARAPMQPSVVMQANALQVPYPDGYFDAVFTDPPYYDNVPYSHLSDFFYVWMKRSIGYLYPELFSTPLTPKTNEIVAYSQADGADRAEHSFDSNLSKAFIEFNRVLKPGGLALIVYAHKSTGGWESVINALLDSGLVVSAAWPINTEMVGRLRSQESAALASSIYIVARKMRRQPTGFYNDVRQELKTYLDSKLQRLWAESISGADFFVAAIGSAIEVFGKYEQVMDFEGNIVRANRLLEEVRVIATNYAVKQILHDDFATEVSPIARFYVLWRWNYGEALVPFDEANKLAHSCGLDLSLQFGKNGFIKKEKEFARLLGPQGRKLDDLDDPRDMIDVLHKSLLLWERGERAEMVKTLGDRGFGRSEAFYRVAQAISETLPLESKEKKLLDGFLAGRDRVQQEVEKEGKQEKLF